MFLFLRVAMTIALFSAILSVIGCDGTSLTAPKDAVAQTDDVTIDDLPVDGETNDGSLPDDPATDNPATDDTATDNPATDNPATDDTATDNPVIDDPATDDTATDNPATDDTATDDTVTDDTATDDTVTDDPTTDNPATDDAGPDNAIVDDSPVPDNDTALSGQCALSNNPCDDGGDTYAQCVDTSEGYYCNCSSGFTDFYSGGLVCDDYNECNNPGACGPFANCKNTTGWYECTCWINYQGDPYSFMGCEPGTKTFTCDDKPLTGTEWNSVSSYEQTWTGTTWAPADSETEYNETGSTTSCRFKCITNYTWNGTDTCEPGTKTFMCAAKPAIGTVWNSVSSYEQTWTGTAWDPADSETGYSETGSTIACRYKCAEDYEWNGEACRLAVPRVLCSGQTKCYDNTVEITCPSEGEAFYGQDAQYAVLSGYCVPRSYTVSGESGSDIVTDNITGLIWQRTLPAIYPECYGFAICEWQGAIDYCNALTYGGYDDWRLPTRREPATLPDYGRYDPAIDTSIFPGTQSTEYWSATASVSDADNAWAVDFKNGRVTDYGHDKTEIYLARCVRGNALSNSVFIETAVGGDVLVTDTATGLVWTKGFTSNISWQDALAYCENLIYGGYTDWRLPNIEELGTLVKDSSHNPASNFPGMPSGFDFWRSSSTVGGTVSYNWSFASQTGELNYGGSKGGTTYSYARCVR